MSTFDIESFSQEEEINHICDYLTKTWDVPPPETLKQIVSNVFTTGWNASSGLIKNCPKLLELLESHQHINQTLGISSDDDILQSFMLSVLMTSIKENRRIEQNLGDFTIRVSTIIQTLKSSFEPKQFSTILPKNYKKLKTCDTETLFEMYSKEESGTPYNGVLLETSNTPDLIYRLAVHNVKYSDEDQGYKPLHTLIGAIYAHGLVLSQAHNEAILDRAISTINVKDHVIQIEDNEVVKILLDLTIKNNPKFKDLQIEHVSISNSATVGATI